MSVEKERLILAEYRIKEADQKLNGANIVIAFLMCYLLMELRSQPLEVANCDLKLM